MTRKDYIKFAEMAKRVRPGVEQPEARRMWISMVAEIADIFEADNPRFDRAKFLVFCSSNGGAQ
jgi:hypothetical protein